MSTSPASISATAAPAGVATWLTLPDESKKLNHEADLRFSAEPDNSVFSINVSETIRYQRMEGFGASMTDSSAFLLMRILSDSQRASAMQNLFTRAGDGISLSYVRVPLGASDFALRNYSYNDLPKGETDLKLDKFSINYDEAYIIPSLKEALALNPQLRFMGSPWSAPGWMKRGGKLNGGPLLPDFYQPFADYLVRFVLAYGERGVPIDSLTPQNEPLFDSDNYPTMQLPAEGAKVFIRDYLGPTMKKMGLRTRLVIFDHNWDLYQYPLTILEDPKAAAFVDGVAFHCYGGDVKNQSLVYKAHPDKGIWFTECSGGEWSVGFGKNVSWLIRTLVIGNFRNWGNSVMLWNLALNEKFGPQNGGCKDCRGVVTVNQTTGAVTYNEEYYALGHVSKFVDPGAQRIDSTNYAEGEPENVAFLNPDGSLVLIVHATKQVTFSVEWHGKRFQYTLPAGGVVTFKWAADA